MTNNVTGSYIYRDFYIEEQQSTSYKETFHQRILKQHS